MQSFVSLLIHIKEASMKFLVVILEASPVWSMSVLILKLWRTSSQPKENRGIYFMPRSDCLAQSLASTALRALAALSRKACGGGSRSEVWSVSRLQRAKYKLNTNDLFCHLLDKIWQGSCVIFITISNCTLQCKFFKSLIIHQVIARDGSLDACRLVLISNRFLRLYFSIYSFSSFCFDWKDIKDIKHLRQCFIRFPNTSNFVKNTPLRVVFSTLFSVFGNRMKHCLSCLIYYLS